MRLPQGTAHYSVRLRFGRYIARRLRRARFTSPATDLDTANAAVLVTGRAWEDTDGPVQDALADRDAADDDVDTATQDARVNLAGRSANAVQEEPYTLVFPDGVGYYTAAPLDQEVARYKELKLRLEEHLPAEDPVRTATVNVIDSALEVFQGASGALSDAKTQETLASTRLVSATDAWVRQVEKTYGFLVGELGRTRAESFFPRAGNKKGKKTGSGGGSGTPGPTG